MSIEDRFKDDTHNPWHLLPQWMSITPNEASVFCTRCHFKVWLPWQHLETCHAPELDEIKKKQQERMGTPPPTKPLASSQADMNQDEEDYYREMGYWGF